MANITKVFSDIDFAFTKRPVVGDVALSYDAQAVGRAIRNLLLTNHFDRLFNPNLGANLTALLFENASLAVTSAIENEIKFAINNYEPRARLQTVKVTVAPDRNSYNATIVFYVVNQTTPTTLSLILTRDR